MFSIQNETGLDDGKHNNWKFQVSPFKKKCIAYDSRSEGGCIMTSFYAVPHHSLRKQHTTKVCTGLREVKISDTPTSMFNCNFSGPQNYIRTSQYHQNNLYKYCLQALHSS